MDTKRFAFPEPAERRPVCSKRSKDPGNGARPYSNQYDVCDPMGLTRPFRVVLVRVGLSAISVSAEGASPRGAAGGGLARVLKLKIGPLVVPHTFCAFRRK